MKKCKERERKEGRERKGKEGCKDFSAKANTCRVFFSNVALKSTRIFQAEGHMGNSEKSSEEHKEMPPYCFQEKISRCVH